MNQNNAFADLFKNSWDFNQIFSTQRRNIEAASEINQRFVESCQAVSRCGAEAVRSNVESILKNSKDAFTGGTPEVSMAKQADLTKSIFENTLATLREISEMVTQSSVEAFEVLNRRAAEIGEEMSKVASTGGKRKNG